MDDSPLKKKVMTLLTSARRNAGQKQNYMMILHADVLSTLGIQTDEEQKKNKSVAHHLPKLA